MSSSRAKAALAFLGVFLLGAVIGGLGVSLYESRTRAARWSWFDPQDYARLLTREVGLRPEQTEKLVRILDEARGEFGRLRETVRPQFREIRDRTRRRIRELLDPEQQAKFEALVKRWDEARERQRTSKP